MILSLKVLSFNTFHLFSFVEYFFWPFLVFQRLQLCLFFLFFLFFLAFLAFLTFLAFLVFPTFLTFIVFLTLIALLICIFFLAFRAFLTFLVVPTFLIFKVSQLCRVFPDPQIYLESLVSLVFLTFHISPIGLQFVCFLTFPVFICWESDFVFTNQFNFGTQSIIETTLVVLIIEDLKFLIKTRFLVVITRVFKPFEWIGSELLIELPREFLKFIWAYFECPKGRWMFSSLNQNMLSYLLLVLAKLFWWSFKEFPFSFFLNIVGLFAQVLIINPGLHRNP